MNVGRVPASSPLLENPFGGVVESLAEGGGLLVYILPIYRIYLTFESLLELQLHYFLLNCLSCELRVSCPELD